MPQKEIVATMTDPKKPGETGPPEFVKRVPFEPMPGELGMNLDKMREAGLLEEGTSTTQGAYDALLGLMKSLKARRQAKGLSLTDVSRLSKMTRQAISKLENGQVTNPTLETLYRYGLALDVAITLGFEEIESEGQDT
jgi:DNA-binding XRE family transcriptional regulator